MDCATENQVTRDMRLQAVVPHIFWMVTSKSGNYFDGVLQDAGVGAQATGHLFGSERFAEGAFVETSTVVQVGEVIGIGPYVETESGHRYLVSSVEVNPHLDVDNWLMNKRRHLAINKEYFKPLQWSS
ncbi:MAG: hypothetical protein V7752_20710 [Halopseudomonas sp.]